MLAHGGRSHDTRRDSHLRPPALRMWPFALDLARHGRSLGLVTCQLRYRTVGFNEGDPVADLHWALDRVADRFGVPVSIVGHSMGARAALLCAGHPAVVSVAALATWITPEDRVSNVEGKAILLAHGLRDRVTDPARSFALAEQLRRTGARTIAAEVAGSGHTMLDRRGVWHSLTREFVLGTMGLAALPSALERALESETEHAARVVV